MGWGSRTMAACCENKLNRASFLKSIQRFAIPLSLLGLVIAIMLPYAPPNYINGDSGIFLYA